MGLNNDPEPCHRVFERPKIKMTRRESSVVRTIQRYLTQRGVWYTKTTGVAQAGVPDLLCCVEGRFWAFEVKRPGEKARPMQEHVMAKIRAAGGNVAVVTSVDDVRVAIWG